MANIEGAYGSGGGAPSNPVNPYKPRVVKPSERDRRGETDTGGGSEGNGNDAGFNWGVTPSDNVVNPGEQSPYVPQPEPEEEPVYEPSPEEKEQLRYAKKPLDVTPIEEIITPEVTEEEKPKEEEPVVTTPVVTTNDRTANDAFNSQVSSESRDNETKFYEGAETEEEPVSTPKTQTQNIFNPAPGVPTPNADANLGNLEAFMELGRSAGLEGQELIDYARSQVMRTTNPFPVGGPNSPAPFVASGVTPSPAAANTNPEQTTPAPGVGSSNLGVTDFVLPTLLTSGQVTLPEGVTNPGGTVMRPDMQQAVDFVNENQDRINRLVQLYMESEGRSYDEALAQAIKDIQNIDAASVTPWNVGPATAGDQQPWYETPETPDEKEAFENLVNKYNKLDYDNKQDVEDNYVRDEAERIAIEEMGLEEFSKEFNDFVTKYVADKRAEREAANPLTPYTAPETVTPDYNPFNANSVQTTESDNTSNQPTVVSPSQTDIANYVATLRSNPFAREVDAVMGNTDFSTRNVLLQNAVQEYNDRVNQEVYDRTATENAFAPTRNEAAPAFNSDGTYNDSLDYIINNGARYTDDNGMVLYRNPDGTFSEAVVDSNGNVTYRPYKGNVNREQTLSPDDILGYFVDWGDGTGAPGGFKGLEGMWDSLSDEEAAGMRELLLNKGFHNGIRGEEFANLTEAEYRRLAQLFYDNMPALQELVKSGLLDTVDENGNPIDPRELIQEFFFKALKPGQGRPRSGSGYGYGYGYPYRGWGGGGYYGGGGGYYGGGGGSSSGAKQNENRVYNIMKNWSF